MCYPNNDCLANTYSKPHSIKAKMTKHPRKHQLPARPKIQYLNFHLIENSSR